jgi:hypothetical protein
VTPGKPQAGEPIDAVYTWAGGDRGELRYSLRSLQRYAPWIRKVFLVTDGAAPAWAKPDLPRLAVVHHKDIFRDPGALPTSNSEAIAWQIFRIPGLSRQFLYLDRNCCLGQPLQPGDFMTAKGGYRFFVGEAEVPAGSAAAALLNSRFGTRSARKLPARIPRLLDRSFLEEVHRLWEKQIQQTIAHRQPQADDVSMETLYFYFLVESPLQYGAHEKASVTPEICGAAPRSDGKQVRSLLNKPPRFFRLEAGTPGILTRLFLRLHYWRRSSWEKK